MFCYVIALLDKVTQEPITLFIKGEDELEEVINNKPDHHILSSMQNIGPVEDAKDYIKRIKEERTK